MAYTENPILEGKDFESISNDINENFNIINNEINSRNEVIFGYYIGDYSAPDSKYYSSTRVIDFGFTPICVELWRGDGDALSVFYADSLDVSYIGIATTGSPAKGPGGTMFSIVNNGISVISKKDIDAIRFFTKCNDYGVKYFFKAYKDIIPSTEIKEYK